MKIEDMEHEVSRILQEDVSAREVVIIFKPHLENLVKVAKAASKLRSVKFVDGGREIDKMYKDIIYALKQLEREPNGTV